MDIEVEYLRTLIRKSHALGYINIHRYEVWISHVNEIGKIVGGWMKAAPKGRGQMPSRWRWWAKRHMGRR